MKWLAKLQGYRTLILNAVLLATALFGRDVIPVGQEDVDAILVAAATVGNIWLRVYTKTPIGQREAEAGA